MEARSHDDRRAACKSAGLRLGLLLPRIIERKQVSHIRVRRTLRQLREYMQQVVVRLDAASPARQHQAVDRGAGLCAINRVTEQPRFSRSGKRPYVALLSAYRNYADFEEPTKFMI